MTKLIEIKANVGIVFIPLYCQTTTKFMQDFHIHRVNEADFIDADDLDEMIISETQDDIRVFTSGHDVVAEKGSGYLYLGFTPSPFSSGQTGTYLFPMGKAQEEFLKVAKELKSQINSEIKRNKWEEVTVFRKLK